MTNDEHVFDAWRRNRACKVCGAMPDREGDRRHGRGCYQLDENGGGSDSFDPYPFYDPHYDPYVARWNTGGIVSRMPEMEPPTRPIPQPTMICGHCGARVFVAWFAFGIAGMDIDQRLACGQCAHPRRADIQRAFPDHDPGDEDRTERNSEVWPAVTTSRL